MPAPLSILNKVKLLLNLSQSPNPNEASNARAMADKLIAKYNITEEELGTLDPKEYYGENEKLFVTFGLVPWRQHLAVAVSKYFDCQIVQEQLAPVGDGIIEFRYFVYGDDDQVKDTQFVYHAFSKKIDKLVETGCIGRGPIYVESYCEGVVESVKWNIEMYGIDVPEIKKPLKKEVEQKSTSIPRTGIVKSGENKEEPTDNRVNINDGHFIKDIMAYFKGLNDGKGLSLQDILELEVENEEAKQIESPPKEDPA